MLHVVSSTSSFEKGCALMRQTSGKVGYCIYLLNLHVYLMRMLSKCSMNRSNTGV